MARRARKGEMTQGGDPDWGPLLRLLGRRLVSDFMWMFEVRLRDGTALQAYKHIDTRCYIHLDETLQAYVYEPPDWYRPMDAVDVLCAVFRGLGKLAGVERPQVEESWDAIERLWMVSSNHQGNH
jgi:hypothetical protein